jgi:prepilin-type N-terminal cleavage/methylation domain-containing protein
MHAMRSPTSDSRGFSLLELLVVMAVTLVIMGGTMTALGNAWKATDSANLITGLNTGLKTAMDLMVRDLLQVGQGLPPGRTITIPSGSSATPIRLPGPPGTNYTIPTTTTQLTAVMPGPGRGPVINGVATDMITTIATDSSFESRCLVALTNTSMTVAQAVGQTTSCGAQISDGGDDDVKPGDLLMLWKGSFSALVQVTEVTGQAIHFDNDSMNLNQNGSADGIVADYRTADGGEPSSNGKIKSSVSRLRMITYYLDATTDPGRPRLVRRLNNGLATTFDNTLGTAVAFDMENLQFTYDLADDAANPVNVRMTAADLQPGGACGAVACDPERIRKVNVLLAGRARRPMRVTEQLFRNTLMTQVSLRSLAFVDRYE